jgi:hypothetical protein
VEEKMAVQEISTHPMATERTEYVRNGPIAYFQKPLNFRSLMAKLDQIFPCAWSAAA